MHGHTRHRPPDSRPPGELVQLGPGAGTGPGFLTAALCSRGQREGPGARAPSLVSRAATKRCGAARTRAAARKDALDASSCRLRGTEERKVSSLVWFGSEGCVRSNSRKIPEARVGARGQAEGTGRHRDLL